jgi:hypothetical protein
LKARLRRAPFQFLAMGCGKRTTPDQQLRHVFPVQEICLFDIQLAQQQLASHCVKRECGGRSALWPA